MFKCFSKTTNHIGGTNSNIDAVLPQIFSLLYSQENHNNPNINLSRTLHIMVEMKKRITVVATTYFNQRFISRFTNSPARTMPTKFAIKTCLPNESIRATVPLVCYLHILHLFVN